MARSLLTSLKIKMPTTATFCILTLQLLSRPDKYQRILKCVMITMGLMFLRITLKGVYGLLVKGLCHSLLYVRFCSRLDMAFILLPNMKSLLAIHIPDILSHWQHVYFITDLVCWLMIWCFRFALRIGGKE